MLSLKNLFHRRIKKGTWNMLAMIWENLKKIYYEYDINIYANHVTIF